MKQLFIQSMKTRLLQTWQVALVACLLMLTQIVSAANTVEITTYYHNDHTGTPVAATDENGNVLWREDYSPYGEQLTQDPKAATNRRGFTGHVQDRDLGLVYMQARYYDPVLGRFMAIDPVGVMPGNSFTFNRYAYANNNPYKYIDPNGEFAFLVPVAIWGVGAALTAYDTYTTYQEEGAKAAVESLAVDGAATLAGGVVGKLGVKAYKGLKAAKRCCFVAGTKVLTESGYKNIEDIKLGDKVWSKDTETEEEAWKPVTKLWTKHDRDIYKITLKAADGSEQKVEATDDHPFYVENIGWKKTVELQVGDAVESNLGKPLIVQSVVDEKRTDVTYNLTVADFHTYYVTARNLLVHNCGGDQVKTPHTQVTGGNKTAGAPKSSQPNSIHEQTRPDGSKSVTYYDDKGRMFSREDYGQRRTHGQLGLGPDGRSVPHEHGVDWSDRGPIGKKYRELDSKGKPAGSWINE